MPERDPEKLLQQGRQYVDIANDAADRKILREEQLYVWENPLLTLDEFLSDSEILAQENEELQDLRSEAREAKVTLEKAIAAFLEEEYVPPGDGDIEGFLGMAMELADAAEEALDKDDPKDAVVWEEPLVGLKSWLADSEILLLGVEGEPNEDHMRLAAARGDLMGMRDELEERVHEFNQAWIAADKKAGYK